MTDTTVLPDGSAFFTGSFPLPKDHWLYAPRCAEWDNVRDTTADTPHPILNNSHRPAVIAAIRYAVRGATMCGQDMDFDPDALALNAAYALCGPATGRTLPADTSQPLLDNSLPSETEATASVVGMVQPNNDEVICPECAHQFRAIPVNVQRLLLASGHEPPFTAAQPPSAPLPAPLTEDRVWADDEIMSRNAVGGLPMHDLMRLVRAVEAAHGITATTAQPKEQP